MSDAQRSSEKKSTTNSSEPVRPKCGIIMPISGIGTYSGAHWEDIKAILREAVDLAGFEAELVSDAEDSTIIQKTIVHNLYNNEIVVCDISGKNPNVMFELGIRLTFDKPTVVVKDDETDYSFDTSSIEHLLYPRGLHYHQMVQFKKKLAAKVKATHEAGKDPNYSTFLKHFGQFTVPKLDEQEISTDQFVINRLEELTQAVIRLDKRTTNNRPGATAIRRGPLVTDGPCQMTDEELSQLTSDVQFLNPRATLRNEPEGLRLLVPATMSSSAIDRVVQDVRVLLEMRPPSAKRVDVVEES